MIILWLYCYCQICMSSKLKHVHCDIQCQHVRLVPPLTYIGDTSLTSISRTEGLVGTSCLDRKCSGYTPSILQSSWDAQFLVETSKNVPSPWHHGATIMGTTHQAGGICLAHHRNTVSPFPWWVQVLERSDHETGLPQPGRCSTLTIVIVIIIIKIILIIIIIFMRGQNSPHPLNNMLVGVITSTSSSWEIKIRNTLWAICWLG